jgi:hypothetical protein
MRGFRALRTSNAQALTALSDGYNPGFRPRQPTLVSKVRRWRARSSSPILVLYKGMVLLIGDVLHPVESLAVEFLLNSDMRHSAGCSGPVPVPFTGRNQATSPGRISSTGPSGRCSQPSPAVTISVCPSGSVCHAVRGPDSNLTLAPETRAGIGPVGQRIDAYASGEPIGRSFQGRLRADSDDPYMISPLLSCIRSQTTSFSRRCRYLSGERGDSNRNGRNVMAPVDSGRDQHTDHPH